MKSKNDDRWEAGNKTIINVNLLLLPVVVEH